jgi:DNA-binding CsgD family transcriptional regulator
LLGRGRELEQVNAFLDRLPAGLTSLALTGLAGIGKTTVWREATDRAVERGYTVLGSQPAHAEQSLSWLGFGDLFADLPEEVLGGLAPMHRHALEVAARGAEPDPSLLAPRSIPAACLAALRMLSDLRPVLVAVDDAQWLDAETAESLAFALRRLEKAPVGVLVSVRLEPDRPTTFDTTLPMDRRDEMLLGPLSLATLQHIIKLQTHQELTRPTLVRIAMACEGNPFYAVEIARELDRVGVPPPADPLPVPSGLQGLVRSRMSRLPRRTQDALLVAACASYRSTDLVDLEAIGPAEEAGIVSVSRDGRVRFTHPLLAAAVVASSSTARCHAAHLDLAGRVEDPEERARHYAASTNGPDARVAAALDEAAVRAAERGNAAAVDLGRQAIELTPSEDSEQLLRRVVAFAHYVRLTSGYAGDLESRVEAALSVCPPGDLRVDLLLTRASLSWGDSDVTAGYEAALEVLTLTDDPVVAARAHFAAVWCDKDDPLLGLEHLDALLGLIDEGDDALVYASALMHRAYVRLIAGLGADDDEVRSGAEIEARAAGPGWWDRSPVPIIWPLLNDRLSEAADVHLQHLHWSRQVGDTGVEHSMLSFLSQIELLRGNYDDSVVWCEEFAHLAEQNGSEIWQRTVLFNRGMLAAHAGRLDEAVAMGEEALGLAQQPGRARSAVIAPRQVLGFAALSDGDCAAAAEHFGTAADVLEAIGQREPAQWRFHPDLAEALLAMGNLEHAEQVVQALERRARALPRPWILCVSRRCRGQLQAHAGDLEGASAALDAALRHHADLEIPYELGRTLLAKGQLLRRRNERRAARAALEDAVEVFERAGSIAWADRARDELKRIPVRRSNTGLTPTEQTVADLASAGLTNKQIAERAFLSPKTVEGNLTRIYLKLGVHSRAELVRAMVELERASS